MNAEQVTSFFSRGATFTCTAFLPDTLPDGFFLGWELRASVRKLNNNTNLGKIATLQVSWADPETTRQLLFYFKDTSAWPLGLAELNTTLVNSNGEAINASPVVFEILKGIV